MPGQFWPDVSHQLHLILVTFIVVVLLINSCEYQNVICHCIIIIYVKIKYQIQVIVIV